jgi:hypothetical protein
LNYRGVDDVAITHVAVYPLSDRNYTVSFTPQQRQAIQAAFSNSTVQSVSAGERYYVYFVEPVLNGTVERGRLPSNQW